MKHIQTALLALGLGIAAMGSANAAGTGYYAVQTQSAAQLLPGPGWVLVASATVGAGTWVVQSSSPAVNFGAYDITRCSIQLDGNVVSETASNLGGNDSFPVAAEMTNLAVVTTHAGQVVALDCGHDGNVSGQRIDPGAWLIITRAPKK